MTDWVLDLARPAIRALTAYQHAHWDPRYERLHANESPWPPAFASSVAHEHLYPEPQPPELVEAYARYLGVNAAQVLLGRGSDEGIDLLTRSFCEAGRDSVLICPPTFGMYRVAADIQGVQVVEVPLRADFSLDVAAIVAALERAPCPKILWLCTPNNPTGTALAPQTVQRVLEAAAGRALVVVDEAYAEFDRAKVARPTLSERLQESPHLVVLRTLSKAHALAGARVGAVIADAALIALLRKVIPPYAIARASAADALAALAPATLAVTESRIATLLSERDRVNAALAECGSVLRVFPSAANFLLVEFTNASRAFTALRDIGLLVRDFTGKSGLGQVLRISIGTPEQNTRLIEALTELR